MGRTIHTVIPPSYKLAFKNKRVLFAGTTLPERALLSLIHTWQREGRLPSGGSIFPDSIAPNGVLLCAYNGHGHELLTKLAAVLRFERFNPVYFVPCSFCDEPEYHKASCTYSMKYWPQS